MESSDEAFENWIRQMAALLYKGQQEFGGNSDREELIADLQDIIEFNGEIQVWFDEETGEPDFPSTDGPTDEELEAELEELEADSAWVEDEEDEDYDY